MSDDLRETLLTAITSFYLSSADFNGMPFSELLNETERQPSRVRDVLAGLVENDRARLIFSSTDINPHIIRTGFESKQQQLTKLATEKSSPFCCYPSKDHLALFVDSGDYQERPYDLELALGEPQLAVRSFDPAVLEIYRNDPRYYYVNTDVDGTISCYGSDNQKNQLEEGDRALIHTFGFAYDEDMNRAVAVCLRYLSDLTPEHQRIWHTKELEGSYRLHPDYARTIMGIWSDHVPICTAILSEVFIINKMSLAMRRKPLFRRDFGEYGENKPERFGLLIRPTLEEFNGFILTLDKMLSENINLKFFDSDVPYEAEIERKDGKVQVQRKGTLQILDDWIRSQYSIDDWGPWDESIATLRRIRYLRHKPAHALDENKFDQAYFAEQRDVLTAAYRALLIIRLMFASHPWVKSEEIEIPSWLEEGKIRTY